MPKEPPAYRIEVLSATHYYLNTEIVVKGMHQDKIANAIALGISKEYPKKHIQVYRGKEYKYGLLGGYETD